MRCFFLICFAFLASCSHSSNEDVVTEDVVTSDVEQKNKGIELIPIFNASEQETLWNVSDELTQLMAKMECKDRPFIVNESERWMNFDEAFLGVQQDVEVADFAVIANLLQHSIIPLQEPISCSSVLLMKIRLVIFDLRQQYPIVIVDQVLTCTHSIPNKYTYWNYSKNAPGSCHYEETPFSKAHLRLATILMEKIQEHAK